MTQTTHRSLVFTPEMRRKWEEEEEERQRLAHIFTTDRDPDVLNVEAIRILIGWAEQDVNYLQRFRSLGNSRWDQTNWAQADVPSTYVDPESITMDEDGQWIEDEGVQQAADKAMLNGACQTAFCMAGQAVTQAGFRMLYEANVASDGGYVHTTADSCVQTEHAGFDEQGWPITVDVGSHNDIWQVAQAILGMTYEEQDRFFSADNGIEDLKEAANAICEERELPPMYLDSGLPF